MGINGSEKGWKNYRRADGNHSMNGLKGRRNPSTVQDQWNELAAEHIRLGTKAAARLNIE
jgi:hypothetical protein